MVALLAYMRGRPLLSLCLMIMGVGISAAARSGFGSFGFWLGILTVIGGLLLAIPPNPDGPFLIADGMGLFLAQVRGRLFSTCGRLTA